jgi:hypothetical protein
MSDPDLTSSDQWAFEIAADQLIKELRELLRDHNADEVADLMEERRRRVKYRAGASFACGVKLLVSA